MTPKIFKVTTKVMVSNYDEDNYWIGNGETPVYAGTSLPALCTTTMYSPSKEGMIGKFNVAAGTWTEIVNRMVVPFFDVYGNAFVCESVECELPEDAIEISPPECDPKKFDVLFDVEKQEWNLLDVRFGQLYYDKFGNELTVSQSHFVLPKDHSFTKFEGELADGFGWLLENDIWIQVVDQRDEVVYAKTEELGDYQVEELGESIPDTHTLEPREAFSVYVEGDGWVFQKELARESYAEDETEWNHIQIAKVVNRIDQYERDQKYAEDMRVSKLTSEQVTELMYLRRDLCLRSDLEDFPFDIRPLIPTFV